MNRLPACEGLDKMSTQVWGICHDRHVTSQTWGPDLLWKSPTSSSMGSCRSSSSNSWDALSGESNTVINVLNQSIVLIMSSPDRSRSGLLSSGLVSSAVVSSVESVLEDDDAMAGLSALQLEWVETLWTIILAATCLKWLHFLKSSQMTEAAADTIELMTSFCQSPTCPSHGQRNT